MDSLPAKIEYHQLRHQSIDIYFWNSEVDRFLSELIRSLVNFSDVTKQTDKFCLDISLAMACSK